MDTGANISLLKPDNLFGHTKVSNNDCITITGISSKIQMKTAGRVFPQMNMNNWIFPHPFHILEDEVNVQNDGILGNDFLIKYGAVIDCSTNLIQIYIPSTEAHYVKNPLPEPKKEYDNPKRRTFFENNSDKNLETEINMIQEDFKNNICKINIGKSKNKLFYTITNDNFDQFSVKSLTQIELPPNDDTSMAINYIANEKSPKNFCYTDRLNSQESKIILKTNARSQFIFENLNMTLGT